MKVWTNKIYKRHISGNWSENTLDEHTLNYNGNLLTVIPTFCDLGKTERTSIHHLDSSRQVPLIKVTLSGAVIARLN